MTDSNINLILEILNYPFYKKWDFWISFLLGAVSIFISWLAFKEARAAKDSAKLLAKSVKIQSIIIEISELSLLFYSIDYSLTFKEADDILTKIQHKYSRLIAPFKDEEDIIEECLQLSDSLKISRDCLNSLLPIVGDPTPNSIYFGMQNHFVQINQNLALLLGKLETRILDK